MHYFSGTSAIFRLNGSLDASTAKGLEAEVSTCLQSPACEQLLIDLGRVDFLDSAGLVCLVTCLKQSQELAKAFRLHNPSPSVRILLELTQLDQAFEIIAGGASSQAA